MANLKKLDMGEKVTKITLEHDSTFTNISNHDEILAIAILHGGYNQFGRKIPIETYKEIKQRFNECIQEIKHLL